VSDAAGIDGPATSVAGADILAVMALLPHRFPMLLVDRVEDIVLGVSARGIKAVSINEPFFAGHFPGRPIMPGVLIIEALAQTAGVLALKTLGDAGKGKLVYFMAIDGAKFRIPVEPGCLLDLKVEFTQNRGRISKFTGRAEINGKLAAECSFTAMIADPPAAA
jgi:3-hydroxyacyl-[acyl-carrier-protein] dehydratase